MIELSTIIEEINQQIDGEAFARLLNYHVDKIQINGATLKCFCPIHHELAFRSLIINLKNKTYKCTMKRCDAFEGGNFVHLWSIQRKLEPIEAAMELAEQLKLPIDVKTLRQLGATYAEKAQRDLEAGDLAAARAGIDQALSLDPRNLQLHILSAQIWQEAGQRESAVKEHLFVLEAYLAGKELEAACALLGPLLVQQPACLPFLEFQVELTRRQGDPAAQAEAHTRLADYHQAAGQPEQTILELEHAGRLQPDSVALRERLANLYERGGRRPEALEALAGLAALCEAQGDREKLLATLELRAQWAPEDLPNQERIAQLLHTLGRAEESRQSRLAVVQAYAEHACFSEAERVLAPLIEQDPRDVELLERQAVLLAKAGHSPRAVAAYRHLAALAQEVGQADRVGDYFELARNIDPHDLALRLDQAEWKLTSGDLDGGLNDLFNLADLCLEMDEQQKGMAILDRIAALAPADMDKRLRIGRCLERNGLEEEAYASYCTLVRDFMRQQQFNAAQAICEEARRLRPRDPQTLELRIETHLALKQKSEAIEACREVARAFIAAGDPAGAEAALLRGIKIDRAETQAKIDLARLYEAWERPRQAAQLWIEMALFQHAREDHAQANEAIREALRLEPANREARIMLAEGLELEGHASEALEIWEQIGEQMAEENPEDSEALAMLRHALDLAPRKRSLLARVTHMTLDIEGAASARASFCQWLESFNAQPDPAEALKAYRLAVLHYPEETAWRAHLADMLLDAGENEEAATHLEKLLLAHQSHEGNERQRHAILEQLSFLKPDRLDLRAELAHSLASEGYEYEAAKMFQGLGEQHLKGGSLDAAMEMFQAALAIEPDYDDLLARMAELYEENGRTVEAIGCYERLAEIKRRQTDPAQNIPVLEKLLAFDPDRLELRAELAEYYEMDGDNDRAVDQQFRIAKAYAKQGGQTARIIPLCLKIRSMMSEYIPARELLIESWLDEGSIEDAKNELDGLGDLALRTGELERAETYFKRIQEIDPDDISSNERLGKLYEAHQRLEEATEAFHRVLAIYEKLGETARAISVLQKLKQLCPEDLDLRGRLARMLLEQSGERREAGEEWHALLEMALERDELAIAQATLDEAIPVFRQDWPWRIKTAHTWAMATEPEAAAQTWAVLAKDALEAREFNVAREAAGEGLLITPELTTLRELRIEANRRLSNYESAAQDLRDMAERAAAREAFDQAERYLHEALELQPRSAELLEMIAEIQSASGRLEEACATRRRLAEIYRQNGQPDQAIRCAQRLAELKPEDLELKDYLATLLIEAQRTGEALAIWQAMAESFARNDAAEAAITRYARILEFLPGNIDILRRLADLTYDTGGMLEAMAHYDRLIDALHAQDDADELELEYLRILELEPGHLQMKERMADFLVEQGRVEEARQTFLAIVAAYRDERDQLADAIRVLRHMKAIDPDNLEVREQEALLLEHVERTNESAQAWRQLAAAYRRMGDMTHSAQCLAHGAEIESDQVDLQIETAELFEEIDDDEKATHYYLRAIEIHDRNDHLDQCIPILEQAIRLNPERFDLPDALARIFERLGQMHLAAHHWLRLGDLYQGHGQKAAARQTYVRLRTLLPEEMECRRRLAHLYEEEGDRAGALRELRDLARLAHEIPDLEQEADHLMRVLTLDPHDEPSLRALAGVWRSLGWKDELYETLGSLERLYCAAGKYDEALATLGELKGIRPDDPELMDRSIDLLVKTGHTAEAASQGIDLIQTYFTRGDDHHALETLRRIAEIEPGNIGRRISLARLIHANRRESDALQEFFLSASKLLGESQWEGCLQVCEAGLQLFPEDVRLRDIMGRVLIKLGRQGEAIEVQLHLAALYDGRGEDATARRVYEVILEEQPDHQATLEAMIDWALRHERTGLAVDHLIRLAESHYMGGNPSRAVDAMERIQELDPSRFDLRARLAEIYQETGDPTRATLTWIAAARGMIQTGRFEAAIEIFERLATLQPDSLDAAKALADAYGAAGHAELHQRQAIRLGDLYCERGQTDDALELFEELAMHYPGEPVAWERLTALYESLGEAERAGEAHHRLFEIHRNSRRLDQAKSSLEAALAARPADKDMLEDLGDLCLSLSRRPEGVESLAKAARLMQAGGDNERARDLAARIIKLDPFNLDIRRLLAEALEATGNPEAAMEEFMQAARGYAEARENAPAIAILSHLLMLDPGRIEERELYSKLLHREGRIDDSIDQYLLLLGSYDSSDDPRRAIKYCRQILAERPDHPEAHAHLADIHEHSDKLRQAAKECEWLTDYYLAKNQALEAEKYIRRGLGWFPEDLGMRTRLVDLFIALGRQSEASAQLGELAAMAEARADTRTTAWAMAKACEIEPDNIENHQRLADYQERTGNLAAARETRLSLIRLMLTGGNMDAARMLAERVVESVIEDDTVRTEIAEMFEEARLPEVAAFHYYQLARHALAGQRYEEARSLAQRALALKPRHIGAREALIEALLARRENGEAISEYERLFEIHDEAGEWDAALRTLQAIIDLAPSRPEPRARLIALYRKMHREEAMLDQLRRLAEIHVNMGDIGAAITCLHELMDERPDDTQSRIRYIDLYAQLGDEVELIDDYRQLARIFAHKGAVIEATRAYEKVIELSPDDPAGREELVHFLFEQGQVNRAIDETRVLADLFEQRLMDQASARVLERALNYAPHELELRQRLAAIYMRTNRRGLALETYRTLARHYEHADNEAGLIEVTEKIVQIDALNVEFRQRLADFYHHQGRQEEAFEQYGVLAEQYVERGLYDLAEHEYRRMIEIQPDNIELWQQVVEIHLQIGTLREIIPDLVMLTDLYEMQGRLKDAVGVYRRILQCEPDNLDILNRYIETYSQIGLEQDLADDYLHLADIKLKRGEVGEAIRIYKHLIEVTPDNTLAKERLTETQRMAISRPGPNGTNGNGTNGHGTNGHGTNGNGTNGNGTNGNGTSSSGTNGSGTNGHGAPAELKLSVRKGETGPEQVRLSPLQLKVVRNYENILKLNPNNPTAHAKLAELLELSGDMARADEEWEKAAEHFFNKGEVDHCIEICDRYLQRHPENAHIRERLSRALVQRDSLRAIDGALAAELSEFD